MWGNFPHKLTSLCISIWFWGGSRGVLISIRWAMMNYSLATRNLVSWKYNSCFKTYWFNKFYSKKKTSFITLVWLPWCLVSFTLTRLVPRVILSIYLRKIDIWKIKPIKFNRRNKLSKLLRLNRIDWQIIALYC